MFDKGRNNNNNIYTYIISGAAVISSVILIQPVTVTTSSKIKNTNDLIQIDFATEVKRLTTEQMNLDLDDYSDLQQALTTAAEKAVSRVSKQPTQEWMTLEILDLMEERIGSARRTLSSTNSWTEIFARN